MSQFSGPTARRFETSEHARAQAAEQGFGAQTIAVSFVFSTRRSRLGGFTKPVIQALLGHASPDTVMIYATLYPGQLIEEYRKTVRSLYNAYYGDDGLKNPTAEE
jgi:hypothetical protein